MKHVKERVERIERFLEWIKEHPEIPPYRIPILYSALTGLSVRTIKEYYQILKTSGRLDETRENP